MCPIIVFASSKQRSSRWLQHGYFYTSRHLMSASKWALHVKGLDLTGKNSGIKAENTMLRNILVQQRRSKTAAFDFDTIIILSARSCYFSSHARMKCRLYVSGVSNSFYLYFSPYIKGLSEGNAYDSSSQLLHDRRHWIELFTSERERNKTTVLMCIKSVHPHIYNEWIEFKVFSVAIFEKAISDGREKWGRTHINPTVIM